MAKKQKKPTTSPAAATSASADGALLGVPLAVYAERLGARVSLASSPGKGATFSVEVPIEFKGKQLEALMPS